MADKQSRGLADFEAKVYGDGEYIIPKKDADKLLSMPVKVDVDVSEALTGLKALQREAKKATQALAELESQMERLKESPPIRSYTVGAISSLEIGGAGE